MKIPAQAEIPDFARQRSYPTVERHGQVYFFLGSKALFPLPFFEGTQPEAFRRGRPFEFTADLSWHMVVANGFDEQHFQSVHDRRLLEPPDVTCLTPWSRRVRYRAEVVGDSIYDAVLRHTVGQTVEISITSCGGPLVLVTGKFKRTCSYLMICIQPLELRKVRVVVTVFAPRSRHRALRGLGELPGLEARRVFTRGFMQRDIARLRGIRYNHNTLVESDLQLRGFFGWLTTLPDESHEKAAAPRHAASLAPDLRCSRPGESIRL